MKHLVYSGGKKLNDQQHDSIKDNLKFFILSREKKRENFFFTIRELPDYKFGIFIERNGNFASNQDIAKIVGQMLEEKLEKKVTLDKRKLEIMIFEIHKEYREKYGAEGNSCSIVIFITDYSKILFVNTGNLKYIFSRDKKTLLKNRDHTVAYLMYEANKISYEDIKKRENSNRLIHKFGVDKSIVIDITEPISILKDDKILVYNHDIWKLIEEYDVLSLDPNKLKKIFEDKEDYLFFKGTFLELVEDHNNIKEAQLIKEKTLFSTLNKYKIYLGGIFLLSGLIFGGKTYFFHKTANQIYALAVKNETVGNVEFENQNFKLALREYEVSLQKYIEYYNYTGKVDSGKEEYMHNMIKQTEAIIDIQEELDGIEELIYNKEFRKALKNINFLNLQVQNLQNKGNLEKRILNLYTTALIVNIAYENKLTADSLMRTYHSNPSGNYELKKKAEKLYGKSALVFLENSFVDLYEEIAEKQILDIDNIIKYQDTNDIIKSANSAFRDFKYYKSLKLYTSALKLTKNPKTIEMLNSKIKMNNIVLKGVESELEGDKIKRRAINKRDMKRAITKYTEAKKYYSILEDNPSISKTRYQIIIDRVTKKINGE